VIQLNKKTPFVVSSKNLVTVILGTILPSIVAGYVDSVGTPGAFFATGTKYYAPYVALITILLVILYIVLILKKGKVLIIYLILNIGILPLLSIFLSNIGIKSSYFIPPLLWVQPLILPSF